MEIHYPFNSSKLCAIRMGQIKEKTSAPPLAGSCDYPIWRITIGTLFDDKEIRHTLTSEKNDYHEYTNDYEELKLQRKKEWSLIVR